MAADCQTASAITAPGRAFGDRKVRLLPEFEDRMKGDATMAFTLLVNGKTHSVDVDGDNASPLGAARRIGHDWHKVRPAHGAVRRLHRAYRRRCDSVLCHPVDGVGKSEITTIETIGATPAGAKNSEGLARP